MGVVGGDGSKLYGKNLTDGFSEELFHEVNKATGVAADLMDGIGVPALGQLDLSVEAARLNGGPLLWQLIDNMQRKVDCEQAENGSELGLRGGQ